MRRFVIFMNFLRSDGLARVMRLVRCSFASHYMLSDSGM